MVYFILYIYVCIYIHVLIYILPPELWLYTYEGDMRIYSRKIDGYLIQIVGKPNMSIKRLLDIIRMV